MPPKPRLALAAYGVCAALLGRAVLPAVAPAGPRPRDITIDTIDMRPAPGAIDIPPVPGTIDIPPVPGIVDIRRPAGTIDIRSAELHNRPPGSA